MLALCVFAALCGAPSALVAFGPLDTIDLTGLDPVNSNPYGVVFHPTAPLGYVALAGIPSFTDPNLTNGRTVVELDLATGAWLRSFPVGLFPTELALSPDGAELCVANSTDSTLSRIDLATGGVQTLALTDSGGGLVGFPSGVLYAAGGQQIWVLSTGNDFDGSDENVVIVDRATGTILRREIVAGAMSRAALLADGRLVLPVGYPDNDFSAVPQVRLYDTNTAPWSLLMTLPLVVDTAAFPGPIDVAVSSDETRAYVSVFEGSSEIFVVDLVTNSLLPAIALPLVDNVQHGLRLTPDGSHLLVTDFFASQVRAVELATGAVVATIATGSLPNSVAVAGGRSWVTNQGEATITVFALPGAYLRGDSNGDGVANLADAIHTLQYLFSGGSLTCEDRADVNDDGTLSIADPIALFGYLFAAGPAPAYPFPLAGTDLTVDSLTCTF
ncbi:MAG: hypothetical protein AB7O52_09430 [Planctomycetota bacterium]